MSAKLNLFTATVRIRVMAKDADDCAGLLEQAFDGFGSGQGEAGVVWVFEPVIAEGVDEPAPRVFSETLADGRVVHTTRSTDGGAA